MDCKNDNYGNSLVVQWLGFRAFTARGAGSIRGQGTKIPQAARRGQKVNKIKIKMTATIGRGKKFLLGV